MIHTNEKQLIELSVVGEIASPTVKQSYRIEPVSGEPVQLPGVGGISYNANLGNPAIGIEADHVEPGVSIRNPHDASNRALNTFACIGNRARVISGEGKALQGWVTGKHGGVDHVMIHFSDRESLHRLAIGDRIQIRSFGTGLKLLSHPEIKVMNLDPQLLHAIVAASPPTEKQWACPVTHKVPAYLLGAGLGEESCQSGDVDIQLFDEEAVAQSGLQTLRFGDFVAMEDCDHRYGRIYRRNWLSIGIVTHSCSVQAGHGPGLTTILTGPRHALTSKIQADANLQRFLADEENDYH